MSDYSFMKTGFNMINSKPKLSEEELLNIECLLSLFISNSTVNAAKYVELSNRNGVTKEDLIYGLRYEVFEFLENQNIMEELDNIKNEILDDNSDIEDEDVSDIIVPDEEINCFERIEDSKYDILSEDEKTFIEKMHRYYDNWDIWVPQSPLEDLLKKSLDKIY